MPRKKDKSLDNIRVGIEIEAEFKSEEVSEKLIEKHRMIQGWKIDRDGSLDHGAEYKPKNSNKLYYNKDSFDQIKEVIALIKVHQGHIKPTCGGHVHIDMSNFSNQEIVNIVKAFIKQQDKIYRKFKVLKSRAEDHARKIPKSVLKDINEHTVKNIRKDAYGNRENEYYGNRDYGLNLLSLERHGTIEWRLFSGSIQIRTWKAYIKFAIEFCIKHAEK